MENIKIINFVESEIAIDTNKADSISKTIIQRYREKSQPVRIDFSDMKSFISPFMRALLKPLVLNDVSFEAIKFDNQKTEQMYQRVLEELTIMGTENIRELHD